MTGTISTAGGPELYELPPVSPSTGVPMQEASTRTLLEDRGVAARTGRTLLEDQASGLHEVGALCTKPM